MAGNFNPEANIPSAQNFLGYSKGVRDSTLGDFATGIAKDLDTGLQTLDLGVAQKAKDETRSVVEDTDAHMLGVSNQPPAVDPLDKEVRTQVRNLEDKKLAMDAGTIDPQHYYATITAKVKDIRARYAGYNDTIDTELQKIGIDPNWQRKQIIEEGLKAQNARANAAQEAARNNREFAESAFQNPKNIIDPAMRAEWAADPNWAQNPNNMKRLKLAVGQSTNIYSRADMAKLEADTSSAENSDNAKKTAAAYDTNLNTIFYAASKNGGVYDLLNKALAAAQNDQSLNNGVVTPEHDQQLRMAYAKFRTYMEQARTEVSAKFSDSPWNWADERKKVDDAFTGRLDAIDRAINNKDWGAIHWNLANNEAMIANEQGKQLSSSEFMRGYAATRKNAGDAGAAIIMQESPDVKDAFTKNLVNGLHADQVSGEINSLNDMMRKARDANINDPKAYKGMLDTSLKLIQSKDTKTVGRLATFETMFSKENQGWWDNVIANGGLSSADKRAYYRTLTSPRMQESVKELGTIDRQATTKYYQYVNYMFNKMNEDSVQDIQDVVTSSNTQKITFDPNTNHLVINNVENPDSTILGSFWDKTRGGEDAIENWNQGIDALIPLWKDQGIDPTQAVQSMMERAGINLNANHTGNAIDNFINTPGNNNAVNLPMIDEKGNLVQRSNLGGPGMEQGAPKQGNPNDRAVTGEDQAAKRAEALELVRELNKTEDPETKQYLRGMLKSLGPFDSYDTLDQNTRQGVDAQYPKSPDLANSRSPGEKRPNESMDKWLQRGGLEQFIASGITPDRGETQTQANQRWMEHDDGSIINSTFFDMFGRYPDWNNKKDYEASVKDFLGGYLGDDNNVPNQAAKALAWDYKGGAEGLPRNELYDSYALIRYFTDPSESNKKRIFDMMGSTPPSDLMNLGGPNPNGPTEPGVTTIAKTPENMNTKSGQQEPGLTSPGDQLEPFIPGSGLLKAISSGDKKEIGKELAMTGVGMLPLGKAVEVLDKAGVATKIIKKYGWDEFKKVLTQGTKTYTGEFRIPQIGEKVQADNILKDMETMSIGELRAKYKPSNGGIATSRNNIVEDNGSNVVRFPGNNRPTTLSNQEGNVTSLEGRRIADEMDAAKSLEDKIPGNSSTGSFSSVPGDKTYSYTRMNPDGTIDKFDGLTKEQMQAISKGKLRLIGGEGKGSGQSTASLRPVDEPSPKGLSAQAIQTSKPLGKDGKFTEDQLEQIRINQMLYDTKGKPDSPLRAAARARLRALKDKLKKD